MLQNTLIMKKYKIGILGAGSIARAMAWTAGQMENTVAYAVASRSMDKARAFAGNHNVERAYGSYEEMLDDPEGDLVYIATPHSHHYEHARMCIERGKPVLCEKAFTANLRQAEALLRLAHERKVFITEAIWTRYMPFTKTINAMVNDGTIGTPMTLTAHLSYPITHKERIRRPELAGGALLDIGLYNINFALMAFGTDISEISSAVIKSDEGMDFQDSITFKYADGKMAALQCNVFCAGDRQGIVCGDKCYFIVDNINNPQRADIYSADHKLVRTVSCPPQITGYEYEVQACIDALEHGRLECEDMPHSETLRVMGLLDSLRMEWGVRYPMDDAEV